MPNFFALFASRRESTKNHTSHGISVPRVKHEGGDHLDELLLPDALDTVAYIHDFLLLLVPFAVLITQGNRVEKIIVLLCYLIPTVALLLYGRAGNLSLIIVSVVMLVLLYARAHAEHAKSRY